METASKTYKVSITYGYEEQYFIGQFDSVDELSDFVKSMRETSKVKVKSFIVKKLLPNPWKIRTQMPGENIIETEFNNDGEFSSVIETLLTGEYGPDLQLISIGH